MTADQDNNHSTGPLMLKAMRSTIGRESTTFGFSILITVSFGVMQSLQGTPVMAEIFLFAVGAVLSFTILEGFLSRGFMRAMPQHRTEVQAMGTSLNLLSVVAGMGVVLLIGTVLPGMFAWALAPFLGSVAYLVLESAEIALAEKILRAKGDAHAQDVSP